MALQSTIKSLAKANPELAKQWHPTKNGELTPHDVSCWSHRKVWWICQDGHEWVARIDLRHNGSDCPICAHVARGDNDLQTLNPELASEWNYERNNKLSPRDVSVHSKRKVWWICKHGHEWQATVDHRSSGCGCPFCANRKVLPGFNDLATTAPHLLKERDYMKNTDLSPTQVTAHSNRKAWWKCHKCGHEWQASIINRKHGSGCPFCIKNKSQKN